MTFLIKMYFNFGKCFSPRKERRVKFSSFPDKNLNKNRYIFRSRVGKNGYQHEANKLNPCCIKSASNACSTEKKFCALRYLRKQLLNERVPCCSWFRFRKTHVSKKFDRHEIWCNFGTYFYKEPLPKYVFGCAKALSISTWFINIDVALIY